VRIQMGADERQRIRNSFKVIEDKTWPTPGKMYLEEDEGKLAVFLIRALRPNLRYWVETDRKTALRTLELIEAVLRDPFTGIGKPEPLKYVLAGCCSRRITQEPDGPNSSRTSSPRRAESHRRQSR